MDKYGNLMQNIVNRLITLCVSIRQFREFKTIFHCISLKDIPHQNVFQIKVSYFSGICILKELKKKLFVMKHKPVSGVAFS